jgi:hypothetical protein
MSADLARGIREAADALDMPPEWLATIISYETGGTFDPLQPGPTTKWGLHRGLIQFGEPQAMQYGVDWSDPLNSQLGEEGAVVRYFRSRGWQPGMSFTDAYSIVNAGSPGLHNARDHYAGGVFGTVADKVRTMQPHFAKGAALLGLSGSPEDFNAAISAAYTGQTSLVEASTEEAASDLHAPEATASSSRDRDRSPSPYYEAVRASNPAAPAPLVSDPARDGVWQVLGGRQEGQREGPGQYRPAPPVSGLRAPLRSPDWRQ